MVDRVTSIVTDPDLLAMDLKFIIGSKILNGNKQKFQKIMLNPGAVKILVK